MGSGSKGLRSKVLEMIHFQYAVDANKINI